MEQNASTTRFGILGRAWVLLRETGVAYFDDKVPRLGAALAYYTTFAVTPLLVIAIGLAGLLFEEQAARERVISEITRLAGADAGHAIEAVGDSSTRSANRIATAVGLATLLFGGLGVFLQLQDALNTIWRAPEQPPEPFLVTMKRRLFSFATVLSTGFLLIISLILSSVLTWLAENAGHRMNWPPLAMETLNIGVSFIVVTFLFAVIFKFLPDVHVRWQAAVRGGVITALLFNVGKAGLAIYFAKTNVASSYGVAGSLILLLLWSYYGGQIVFVGAEFTRIYELTRGGRIPHGARGQKPAEGTPAERAENWHP
jgi:membrane protein